MSRPLSITPNAAAPQPAGKGAAGQAAPGTSDLAVLTLPDLLQLLHSTDAGLSASNAAAVLKTVGSNRIESAKAKGLLTALIERSGNPLVLILLFAAAVSAFTGDIPSFVVIAVIVLMSVLLDVTQERQAENAAERLREQVGRAAVSSRMVRRVPLDPDPGDLHHPHRGRWRCRFRKTSMMVRLANERRHVFTSG
jgi:hypothetical protein